MLAASYFDGRSTRVHPVTLSVDGDDLCILGEQIELRIPFRQVRVDEKLGSAPRRLRLPDGSFCEVHDLDSLESLLAATSHQEGRVDRLQRRLSWVLAATMILLAVLAAGYRFVLPWAAARAARQAPPALAHTLSVHALRTLDHSRLLQSSELDAARRQRLAAGLRALRLPQDGTRYELLFRRSAELKANAFTLPDGTIVVLDELIDALDDEEVLAVLAHELGHAHYHHGLQLLLQSTVVGAFWSFYVGDISQLLAIAPTALVQARYSRKLEQQADDYAAAVLSASGRSPALLADALEKLVALHPGSSEHGYLSSHPATAERMQHLRSLAAKR
jgi:Zn-dependent protease with chaperone function